MIVKMKKVHVVARSADHDNLLTALGDLGVIHVQAIKPDSGSPAEHEVATLNMLTKAAGFLSTITPTGAIPDITPLEAAEQVMHIERTSSEQKGRLTALYRLIKQNTHWGNVTKEQFDFLADSGVDLTFYRAKADLVSQFQSQCVEIVTEPNSSGDVIVAVANRSEAGEQSIPSEAKSIDLPQRFLPSLQKEAKDIDQNLVADSARLEVLANMHGQILAEIGRQKEKVDFSAASNSAMMTENLLAIQGWVPQDRAETLAGDLIEAGVDSAVQLLDPEESDEPPTLVKYPKWVSPIKALFSILGTTPGYREADLSAFFMIALPIFAAMLIGDAGYGLIFTLIPLLMWRKISKAAGKESAQLVLIFGLATLVWGVLTANFFGLTPATFSKIPNPQSVEDLLPIGKLMASLGVLWRFDDKAARDLIIQVSFVFGTIHLVLAHVRAAVGYAPNQKFIAEIGWSAFLVGMLGVVWMLFFPEQVWMPAMVMYILLAAGAGLVLLFTYPDKKLPARIGLGIIGNLLPLISTFSDTMSYIRLMAVGLASYYIAKAFNDLGSQIAEPATWMWIFGGMVILFAHALNIVLGIIAIFAHGVRLNMLEFSSNAGVQWVGYPYQPLSRESENK